MFNKNFTAKTLLLLAVAVMVLTSCSSNKSTDTSPLSALTTKDPARIAKLKTDASGNIFLNGMSLRPDQLKEALMPYKANNGIIWYYREKPDQQPALEIAEVNQVIQELMIPVKISLTEDYSGMDKTGLVENKNN